MTAVLAAARTRGVRAAASAVASTLAAVLPVFLVGGLAVLIARDLHLSPATLGLLVSAYFTASALSSVPVGWLVERYGAQRTTWAGVLVAVASLTVVASAGTTYAVLLVCMLVAGTSSSLCQLGSNLSLAREVPPGRMGLSFGIKQSAIPLGTLVAGVAVPAVGLTLGWRWAFAGAAVLALAALPLVPGDHEDRVSGRDRDSDVAVLALSVVAVGATLASGAANALGAFLVDSAVDSGLGAGLAGAVLAAASAVGVLSRIGGGWLADRRSGGHLLVIAGMLVGGAAGLVLLAVAGGLAAILAGAVLGFGLGWSWPGVLNYAVVRLNPTAPAAATSISQSGVYAGGALGPAVFGVLVHATSYRTAWMAAAASMVAASGLVLAGRSLVIRARDRGPR